AFLTLLPDALARARPEMREACFDGEGDRLCVHPGEHQQVAGVRVRDDRRDQTIRSELGLEHVAMLDFFGRAARSEQGGGGRRHGFTEQSLNWSKRNDVKSSTEGRD